MINSARAINATGAIKGFIAALVILLMILILAKTIAIYEEKIGVRYNRIYIKSASANIILAIISAIALISCYKVFSVSSTPITSIRAGGVFFLLTVLVISVGYIRDKEKTLEIKD